MDTGRESGDEPQIEFWSSSAYDGARQPAIEYHHTPTGSIDGHNSLQRGSPVGAPDGAKEPSIEYFESGTQHTPTGSIDGLSSLPRGSSFGVPRGSSTDPDDCQVEVPHEEQKLYSEASAFEGAAIVTMIEREGDEEGPAEKALEITMEDGVTLTVELDSGEKRLIELGYKQELKRVLNAFQLYCVAVTAIAPFAGVVPMYPQGFLNAGPVGLVWYWWIGVFFVHIVGLSFMEISSSFPMAGSLYFWTAALAGPQLAPVASFFTGWLEFFSMALGLGGVAFAGVSNILSQFIFMVSGVAISTHASLGLAVAVLLLSTLLNFLPMAILSHVFVFSGLWQILGCIVTIIVVPAVATTHQPASFVFGYFNNNRDITLTPTDAYSFILALIVVQFSLYGYDTVCHLAEETKRSDRTAPIAIIASITTVSILGWLLIVSITFSIQDVDTLLEGQPNAPGSMVLQVVWDAFYSRYQCGLGAEILTVVMYSSFFFACVVGIVGASRVAFSLARDSGMPLSSLWRRVNKATGVPNLAVLLCVFIGFAFLMPLFGSTTVYFAVSSLNSAGWVGAYAFPIFFRVIQREDDFCPGPFYMADYIGVLGGKLVHGVALLWVLYTVAAFCLPLYFPITEENFNWAPVALFTFLGLITIWWFMDARRWFRGPLKTQAGDEGAAAAQKVDFFETDADALT